MPEIVSYFDDICSVRGKILKSVLILWMTVLHTFSNIFRLSFKKQEKQYLQEAQYVQSNINIKLSEANENLKIMEDTREVLKEKILMLNQEKTYLARLLFSTRRNEKKVTHDLKWLKHKYSVIKNEN
jgi:hypothetical protein